MFSRTEFIRSFSLLGGELSSWAALLVSDNKSCPGNPFFTDYMQGVALKNIAEHYLSGPSLERLLGYSDGPQSDPDMYRRRMAGR